VKDQPGLTTRIWRIAKRTPALIGCPVGCLGEYFIHGVLRRLTPARRARILQKWSGRLLRRLDIRITVEGEIPAPGLVVSNHLSYLDIMVFSQAAACTFVSKHEVRSWPGIGWIASLSGTIYIDRARRRDTHAIQPEMQAALTSGLRLVVFPEGTSTDGSGLLPFHSSLFQPAIDLNTPVTAACLCYELADGDAGEEVCYWGDHSLAPHLLNLLTKKQVNAQVRFSGKPCQFTDRKAAARTMEEEVKKLRG
jgi:1-acyl-sn-glycerol-3-phosphate acyltransferase